MKVLGFYHCYFQGDESRNAPCGQRVVRVEQGRRYVHIIKDWSPNDCFNFKFKMSRSWWEERVNKSRCNKLAGYEVSKEVWGTANEKR